MFYTRIPAMVERGSLHELAVRLHLEDISSDNYQLKNTFEEFDNHQKLMTFFNRGDLTIKVIDEILPTLNKPINILIVGGGLWNDGIGCCVEPFKVCAHLDKKGVDYSLTLVDIDKDVISDIETREKLFIRIPESGYGYKIRESWQKYLDDTNQQKRIIHEKEDGFNCELERYQSDYLKNGIEVANVPQKFKEKLNNGSIKLVCDNISNINLDSPVKFDYIECINLMYQLSEQQQYLALKNMVKNMENHAYLLINDMARWQNFGTPLFPLIGGWFTDKRRKDLGLRVSNTGKVNSYESYHQLTLLLQKFKSS